MCPPRNRGGWDDRPGGVDRWKAGSGNSGKREDEGVRGVGGWGGVESLGGGVWGGVVLGGWRWWGYDVRVRRTVCLVALSLGLDIVFFLGDATHVQDVVTPVVAVGMGAWRCVKQRRQGRKAMEAYRMRTSPSWLLKAPEIHSSHLWMCVCVWRLSADTKNKETIECRSSTSRRTSQAGCSCRSLSRPECPGIPVPTSTSPRTAFRPDPAGTASG